MINLRQSLFETNSSSVHAIALINKDLVAKIQNQECIVTCPRVSDDDNDVYVFCEKDLIFFDRNELKELYRAQVKEQYDEDEYCDWEYEHISIAGRMPIPFEDALVQMYDCGAMMCLKLEIPC